MIFRISYINKSLFSHDEKPLSNKPAHFNKNLVHKFDVKKAGILDSPERMQFLYPESILNSLKLTFAMQTDLRSLNNRMPDHITICWSLENQMIKTINGVTFFHLFSSVSLFAPMPSQGLFSPIHALPVCFPE